MGLVLSPAKTRIVHLADGFDFLGFHFRRTPMVRKPGRKATKTWPSRRAKKTIRAKIKAVTAPRSELRLPVEEIVKELGRRSYQMVVLGAVEHSSQGRLHLGKAVETVVLGSRVPTVLLVSRGQVV